MEGMGATREHVTEDDAEYNDYLMSSHYFVVADDDSSSVRLEDGSFVEH